MPPKEPVTFTQASVLNGHELIVELSDGTTAVITVEQLLACAPNRLKTEEQHRN